MKKIIILLLMISFFIVQDNNLILGNNIFFNISDFKLKKTAAGYEILFNINYQGTKKEFFEDDKVVLSSEKYRISGIAENGLLKENDLLYSRISFDLDGDGKTDSDIKITNKDDSIYFNGKKINSILSRKNYGEFTIADYFENDAIKSNKLNDTAESFILYNYDIKSKFTTFGFGDKQNPITALYFQNPCVEIIISQETDNILKIPSCSISGQTLRTRFSNETIFSGQEWVIAETWAVIPFQIEKSGKESMKINIFNIEKPFAVILSVKFTLKEGTTLSTRRLINIIN
jgi:hypothetical protein